MTEKEQEFDRLIRAAATNRATKGCKCLEAMLQGYRRPHRRDDSCACPQEPDQKEQQSQQAPDSETGHAGP